MMKTQKLNPQAQLILAQLQSDHGITLDAVEDFGDLMELHRLGSNMASPGGVENTAALLDLPIILDGIKFYRLTFGASLWLQTTMDMWPEADMAHFGAVIFAMAHCREVDAFTKLTDPARTRKAVIRWANKLQCGVPALEKIVHHLLPQTDTQEGSDTAYGPVMSMLLCEVGLTPRHWLWEISADMQCEIVDGISALKFEATRSDDALNPFAPYTKAVREWTQFKGDLISRKDLHGRS